MERAALQLIGSSALGLYIIYFARATFSQPERIRQRWYSWLLPNRQWASTLLRCFAVVWIFCGLLLIANGLIVLPFLDARRGMKLLVFILIVAAVLAGLLAAKTPRRQWSGR